MGFLAAIAVDKRQHYILSADKLKEMVGASFLIASTVDKATDLLGGRVQMVRPVSGEIWVRAGKLVDLQDFLFRLRVKLVEEDRLNVTFAVIEELADPEKSFVALERELQVQKANHATVDGAPSNPYFARCQIQPELPPNRWNPRGPDRRQLVSNSADRRNEASNAGRAGHRTVGREEPRQMQHMTSGEGNSYVGFLKADVDGLGYVQMHAHWNDAAARHGMTAYDLVRKFAAGIDSYIQAAVQYALGKLPTTYEGKYDPVLPLVQAGDDLWLVCRREFALPFAVDCGTEFARLCAADGLICDTAAEKTLTLSFGVLFAKQGFPMDQQLDLAEELLTNAKKRRRAEARPEGYLDFFWLDSSGRETVSGARRAGAGYSLPVETGYIGGARLQYRLYTRPWTLKQTGDFLKAAAYLRDVPARKLHQIPAILRFGGEFTALGLHQWWAHLLDGERKAIRQALAEIPAPFTISEVDLYSTTGDLPKGPWRKDGNVFQTPLLELVELVQILRQGGSE